MKLDEDTWNRARGWTLWKAAITLIEIKNKSSFEAKTQLAIISSLM